MCKVLDLLKSEISSPNGRVDTFIFWGEDIPAKIHTTQKLQQPWDLRQQ